MSTDDSIEPGPAQSTDAGIPWWIIVGMILISIGGGIMFLVLREPIPPAPPEVAQDPLLNQGRTIFLSRCIPCHGMSGRGDGPIAKNIAGPPPGNLTDNEWKHGDQPDQVLRVIAEGVRNSQMNAWDRVLDPPDLRAVTAYVYYLAGRKVPDALRQN